MKTYLRKIDLNRATVDDLRLFISQAGKQANQRLRQLEKSNVTAGSNKYQYVKRAAFKDTAGLYGKTKHGEIKFDLKTRGLSLTQLRKKAANIQKFITPQVNKKTGEVMADTSTVAGVKAKFAKAEETIKKATGAKNISIDDVAGLVEMSLYDRLVDIYGASAVMVMYSHFKEKASGDTSISAFERWLNSKGFKFTDEEDAPAFDDIMDNIDTDFTAEDVDVKPEDNPYMTVDPDADIPF